MQKFQVSTYVYNIMHNYIDNRGDLGLPLQLQMFCTTRNKVRDSEHCDDWLMMRGNCHTSSFNKEKRYLDLRPFINYQKKKSVVCQFVNMMVPPPNLLTLLRHPTLQLLMLKCCCAAVLLHGAPAWEGGR